MMKAYILFRRGVWWKVVELYDKSNLFQWIPVRTSHAGRRTGVDEKQMRSCVVCSLLAFSPWEEFFKDGYVTRKPGLAWRSSMTIQNINAYRGPASTRVEMSGDEEKLNDSQVISENENEMTTNTKQQNNYDT